MGIRAPGETRVEAPKKVKVNDEKYTYIQPQGSWLYTEVLSPYVYDKIVTLYPRWLHPNVITVSGFISVVAGFTLIATHSPKLDGSAEKWVYIATAALFQLYVTFDNTDGKQARRTKMSSAAGETFDHGVDMSVATLGMLIVADAVKMAPAMLLVQLYTAHISTFINNWYHKISGRMSWGGRYISVDEANLLTVLLILMAGLLGPEIYEDTVFSEDGWNPFRVVKGKNCSLTVPEWNNRDCWGKITLSDSLTLSSFAVAAFDAVYKLMLTLQATDSVEGSGRTVTDALTSLAPLGVHLALLTYIFYGCDLKDRVWGGLLAAVLFSCIGLRLVLSMKFHAESDDYRLHTGAMLVAWASTYAISDLSPGLNDVFAHQVVALLWLIYILTFANGLSAVNKGKPLFYSTPKME